MAIAKSALKRLTVLGFAVAVLLLGQQAAQTVWGADQAPAPSTSPATEPPPPPTSSPAPAPDTPEGAVRMRGAMQKFRQACEADIKQFCQNVKPGGGRIIQCLENHSKEVSDGCYGVLEKRGERKK
jgi:hypothetical protein